MAIDPCILTMPGRSAMGFLSRLAVAVLMMESWFWSAQAFLRSIVGVGFHTLQQLVAGTVGYSAVREHQRRCTHIMYCLETIMVWVSGQEYEKGGRTALYSTFVANIFPTHYHWI